METKQIINGLMDRADRVADQSAGRIMKQAAKRLRELDEKVAKDTNYLTNGDRIRAMSDEELAKELGKRVDCAICPIIKGLCNVPCEDALLLWLQQPAEVE